MRNTFFTVSALTLILFMSLVSCKKNTDDTDGGNFYFTAKINGEDFTGDVSENASFGAFKYHEGSLTVSIAKDNANPAAGTFLLNILSGYTGAGTYTVGVGGNENNYARYTFGSMATNNLDFWAAETGSSSTANSTGTGTVSVSSDENNIVEGTFAFDGYNNDDQSSKTISEGKFRLKVQ